MQFYRSLKDFEVLSFDLDDTLYDNNPVIAKAELEFASYLQQRYKLPSYCASLDFWLLAKKEVMQDDPFLLDDVGLARSRGLIYALKKQNICIDEIESNELVSIFINMRSKNIKVSEKVKELLKSLSSKYKLIALSNGNVDIDLIGLRSYFLEDLRPIYKQYRRKPYSDLFQKAISLYNIEPHKLMHVGDEPCTDVHGAIAANCQCTYLKRGYAGSSSDLSYLKILPTCEIQSIFELKAFL